jgi:hypothetical protein
MSTETDVQALAEQVARLTSDLSVAWTALLTIAAEPDLQRRVTLWRTIVERREATDLWSPISDETLKLLQEASAKQIDAFTTALQQGARPKGPRSTAV